MHNYYYKPSLKLRLKNVVVVVVVAVFDIVIVVSSWAYLHSSYKRKENLDHFNTIFQIKVKTAFILTGNAITTSKMRMYSMGYNLLWKIHTYMYLQNRNVHSLVVQANIYGIL